MTDYAIHSPFDGELLIRFHDELVRHGIKSNEEWNKNHNPGIETGHCKSGAIRKGRNVWYYTLTIEKDVYMSYYNHVCASIKTRHFLTPSNFQTVLNEVLQNFGIEYRNP